MNTEIESKNCEYRAENQKLKNNNNNNNLSDDTCSSFKWHYKHNIHNS